MIFVPYLGYKLLPDFRKAGAHVDEHAVYDKPFYRRFRALVTWCVEHRWIVVGATAAIFVVVGRSRSASCSSSSSPRRAARS